jgi:hypothetical protein
MPFSSGRRLGVGGDFVPILKNIDTKTRVGNGKSFLEAGSKQSDLPFFPGK